MSADRYPTRVTNAQAELLEWMQARGAVPTLLIGMPGSTIDLGDLDGAWRDAHGAFTTVDQLAEVDGIGAARLARLREHVRV